MWWWSRRKAKSALLVRGRAEQRFEGSAFEHVFKDRVAVVPSLRASHISDTYSGTGDGCSAAVANDPDERFGLLHGIFAVPVFGKPLPVGSLSGRKNSGPASGLTTLTDLPAAGDD